MARICSSMVASKDACRSLDTGSRWGRKAGSKPRCFAKVIQIGGSVEGTLRGEKRIRLCETGRVRGSLTAPEIVLAGGCKYKGSVDTGDGAKAPEA